MDLTSKVIPSLFRNFFGTLQKVFILPFVQHISIMFLIIPCFVEKLPSYKQKTRTEYSVLNVAEKQLNGRTQLAISSAAKSNGGN